MDRQKIQLQLQLNYLQGIRGPNLSGPSRVSDRPVSAGNTIYEAFFYGENEKWRQVLSSSFLFSNISPFLQEGIKDMHNPMSPPPKKKPRLPKLCFLQKLGCQKPCLVNKQVAVIEQFLLLQQPRPSGNPSLPFKEGLDGSLWGLARYWDVDTGNWRLQSKTTIKDKPEPLIIY